MLERKKSYASAELTYPGGNFNLAMIVGFLADVDVQMAKWNLAYVLISMQICTAIRRHKPRKC